MPRVHEKSQDEIKALDGTGTTCPAAFRHIVPLKQKLACKAVGCGSSVGRFVTHQAPCEKAWDDKVVFTPKSSDPCTGYSSKCLMCFQYFSPPREICINTMVKPVAVCRPGAIRDTHGEVSGWAAYVCYALHFDGPGCNFVFSSQACSGQSSKERQGLEALAAPGVHIKAELKVCACPIPEHRVIGVEIESVFFICRCRAHVHVISAAQDSHPPWVGCARLLAGRLPHFPGPEDLALDALTMSADWPKAAVSLASWDGMGAAVEAGD
ncbi:hypothetical protein A6R68_05036 [Neotoma lepida]|uniref:Uncharacterized protein n=1 Tax=Neotoma lepida TaxID=56216 RepID=A0A1A6GJH9_NEOLE|nr:hypothetical protein A6R68_05036 [Neotoma lepida]